MIFDRFIKLRKVLPGEINRLINRARLFYLDVYPEDLPKPDMTDSRLIRQIEQEFCLPFPVTAIEDKTSCVLIEELEPEGSGIDRPRRFLELHPLDNQSLHPDTRQEHDQAFQAWEKAQAGVPRGSHMLFLGKCYRHRVTAEETFVWWTQTEIQMCLLTPDNQLSEPIEVDHPGRGQSYNSAIEELIYFDQPQNVILERRPCDLGKRRNQKGLYSHERPVYTLVKPREARSIMRLPEPEPTREGGRIVEERRAHWRSAYTKVLRSEKFKQARGRTLEIDRSFVRAVWNGPREADVGKHHYRVIVDPIGGRDGKAK